MHLRRLSAACAAAAGLALLATPALASAASAAGPPFTVIVGGNTSGTYQTTGVNKGNVILTADGIPLTCTDSTLTGSVTAGSYPGPAPVKVGQIDDATFTSCTLASFAATVEGNSFPWDLNVKDVTPPNDADGNVSGVSAHVDVNVLGLDCSFDVTGSVDGHIDVQSNGVQELVTDDSHLTLSNVSDGCAGLLNEGDPATYDAAYDLTVFDQAGNPFPNPPISFTNP